MREDAGKTVWAWRTSGTGSGYSELSSDGTFTDELRRAFMEGAGKRRELLRGLFADYINPGETSS